MEAYGVPGYLVYPAAALELTSGTMLILGVMLMELGVVLSGWCLLTASIFHRDWQGDDGQTQQLMFMKNLCMAGGFLVLASTPHESRSFGTIRQWVKEKLSSNGKEHTSPGEHTNLLPKHLPPSPLYGGETQSWTDRIDNHFMRSWEAPDKGSSLRYTTMEKQSFGTRSLLPLRYNVEDTTMTGQSTLRCRTCNVVRSV